MKKVYTILMLGAVLVACSREEQPEVIEPTKAPVTYTLSIKANKDAGTKGLSLSGNTLNAIWDGTEQVFVFKGAEELTYLTPVNDADINTGSCTLSGSFPSGKLPAANDVLTLKLNAPNYEGQSGTLAFIAGHDDYAVATVTVKEVDPVNGRITINQDDVNFESQQAIIKFILQDKGNSNTAISPTALTITDGTNTATVSTVSSTYTENGAGVLYVAFPAAGEAKTISMTATVGNDTYTYEKSGVTFSNGQYYAITVKMTKLLPATATGHPLSESVVGEIVGSDGLAYDVAQKNNLPASVTIVAMVAYKNGLKGLAIELKCNFRYTTDLLYGDAIAYAANRSSVYGFGSWHMPTKNEWQNMFLACRKEGDANIASDVMNPIEGFVEKMTATGISWYSSSDVTYWTSTSAWCVSIESDNCAHFDVAESTSYGGPAVLACLAF